MAAIVVVVVAAAVRAEVPDRAVVIQHASLNAARPYFVPTHPRVTTTIRFPGPIGAPDGAVAVFTEDAATAPGAEYLVSWQQGDSYFTLTPLKAAPMANLNVPYQDSTYVFYFYQVDDPLKAVAAVSLVLSETTPAPLRTTSTVAAAAPPPPTTTRSSAPPPQQYVTATPSRLLGFIDRLKLLHAAEPGPALVSLTQAMKVEVAVGSEALGASRKDLQGRPVLDGAVGEIADSVTDGGWYQIVLLRAVRDPRLNCIGFVCLIRNTSTHVLAFDVQSFGVRAGGEYLAQRISDASAILKPGEQAPAYFVVQPRRTAPLHVLNDWRISVDLVSPRLNPGAVLAAGFSTPQKP